MESYKRAIDILTSDKPCDFKAIAIGLAKQNPELFLDIIDGIEQKPTNDLEAKVYAVWSAHRRINKVDAIKKCRELTGMGLKDAKDWVDSREYEWKTKLERDIAEW